jgi:hypothetical protein
MGAAAYLRSKTAAGNSVCPQSFLHEKRKGMEET